MAKVLTMASSVLCDAATKKTTDDAGNPIPPIPFHGGEVTKSSSAKLKVRGNSVLLKSGISTLAGGISGCKTPSPPPPTKACTQVTQIISGEATKLKVNGEGVLLEGKLAGITDGNPPGTLPGTANQHKLIAI